MNILLLGDIMGPSGRKAIIEKLPTLIKKKKLDFVIVNGENSADPGVGITKKITEDFFSAGADVITTGNHIWDQKETAGFIDSEKRLLRPQNLPKGTPGNGYGIFISKTRCTGKSQTAAQHITFVLVKRERTRFGRFC